MSMREAQVLRPLFFAASGAVFMCEFRITVNSFTVS